MTNALYVCLSVWASINYGPCGDCQRLRGVVFKNTTHGDDGWMNVRAVCRLHAVIWLRLTWTFNKHINRQKRVIKHATVKLCDIRSLQNNINIPPDWQRLQRLCGIAYGALEIWLWLLLCINPHMVEALSDAFVWRLSVCCVHRA